MSGSTGKVYAFTALSWCPYLFYFVALDLMKPELVAMVMVFINVMHCQMRCSDMRILTACYRIQS